MKRLFSTILLLTIALRVLAVDSFDNRYNKHWTCNGHDYPNSMTIVGVINVDGEELQNDYMEIGAFCDGVCRGSEILSYYPNTDRYMVFMTVYGTANDDITFKLYNHDYEYELELDIQSVPFTVNAILGTVGDPYVFDFSSSITYYSITANVLPQGAGYTNGGGSFRYGDLCTLTANSYSGYQFVYWMKDGIQVSSNSTYTFTVTEDAVYSACYVSSYSYDLYWTCDPHQYEHSMTMVGLVKIDGEEQRESYYEVGAFCGSECRGSAMLQYLPRYDKYLAFLTVYGNDGNSIRFKLYDHSGWYEVNKLAPAFSFVADTICGNPGEPYVFNFTSYLTITTQTNVSYGGTVSGGGQYLPGEYCTVTATPNEDYVFMNWTENDEVVSNNANYSFYVEDSRILTAVFCEKLPELHVTSMSHSNLVAGQEVTVSWTVRNDGVLGTNTYWYDRIWLSSENRVVSGDGSAVLLGTFENLSALEPGESYTQTQTVTVPESYSGEYYLFVITDAYDASTIYWENDLTPIPYNPPPYLFAYSTYYYYYYYNRVQEMSEFIKGSSYHDNFFYQFVNVALPPLPDLQVTAVVAPSNFYSGTYVDVTATISNMGEAPTSVDYWRDALYISNSDVFDPEEAVLLGRTSHQGYLVNGASYQVNLSGYVPLTMYGNAYFYVQTDCYEQVYEHVLDNNNVTRSEMVNIILTPPADLVPYLNSYTTEASTGALFDYSFTVVNEGSGDPNYSYWYDRVYLSSHEDEIGDDAILIAESYHYYYGMGPGGEYTVNGSVSLPDDMQSGTYYLYVFTDATDRVFEYLYDDNNIVKGGTPVFVGIPDLQVLQLNVPDTLTACYPTNISYVVKNVGNGTVANWGVTDLIALSTHANLTNPVSISSKENTLNIQPNETMTVSFNEAIPNVVEGTYYLFVTADYYDDLNEPNENNNTLRKYPVYVAHQPLPDLRPLSLTLPSTINAGNDINIEFDVTNLGELDLLDVNLNISLYATNGIDSILCPVQSQTLPLGYPNVSILVGETVHFVRTVSVSSWVTDAYSEFLLIADPENQMVETDETNNVFSQYATVINCPLPDLRVTSAGTPAQIQSGLDNTFTFNVVNFGDAALEGATLSFALIAYEGDDTIVCPIQTASFENVNMAVYGNQEFAVVAFIPPMLTSNYSYFEVVVDPQESIHELNHGNNANTFGGIVVNYPFDLELVTTEMPTAVLAGRTYTITWTVKNNGTCPSSTMPMYVNRNGQCVAVNGNYLPVLWADQVYVSDDDVVDENDLQLLSVNRNMVLNPNATYTVSQSFVMPYEMVGAKYVIAVADANAKTYDNSRVNNNFSQLVSVDYGPLPDLRITDIDVEEVLSSGLDYMIHYTVVNEGTSATLVDAWTDAFYLGSTPEITQNTHVLGSKVHYGVLEAGDSYTDSIQLNIPYGVEGSYYFMGFTDARSLVFENNNEDDNLLSMPVTVMIPQPCDLMLVDVTNPATVQSGDEIEISWQISNIGDNIANGRIKDAIYLSVDAEYSSDDLMLGVSEAYIDLMPNGVLTRQMTVPIQGVAEGNYYVIVRTNIQRVLNESTYDNNIIVSVDPMAVTYPLLAIGSDVDRTMEDGQYLYYRIEVGEEYAGQTLSCRLTTTSNLAINKLYLSYNDVPTLSSFEFSDATPFDQELEILVPVLNQGSYYLLATGSESNNTPQNVNIAASIVHFEILHVETDHGSNAGSVTAQVLGAKFDSIMDFRLVQGNTYLPAEKVFFNNSTESYVTFNLKDMPAGNYGMAAELPGGIITVKDQAFVVEEGMPAELAINIVAPSSVRTGSKFTFNIEYGNYGSTDLNVSGFLVVSNYPIALQSDSLVLNQHELTFMIASDGGNPDVLRPGHMGTKTVFIYASQLGDISIKVYAIRRQY